MTHRITVIVCAAALLAAGCQQDMAKQPVGRPLSGSTVFPDGRSARPLVAGTVPRGSLADPDEVRTGRVAGSDPAAFAADVFVAKVPLEVTEDLLKRGQQRFDIFCAVCHGRLGDGHGKIPERGFTTPTSFYHELSRGFKLHDVKINGAYPTLVQVPDGYIFDVISRGYGAMPDYASQVPAHDRWAIVTYIRALQKSQRYPEADVNKLPEDVRQALKKEQEK
jgi:mono/diheme cytochrome c family protein